MPTPQFTFQPIAGSGTGGGDNSAIFAGQWNVSGSTLGYPNCWQNYNSVCTITPAGTMFGGSGIGAPAVSGAAVTLTMTVKVYAIVDGYSDMGIGATWGGSGAGANNASASQFNGYALRTDIAGNKFSLVYYTNSNATVLGSWGIGTVQNHSNTTYTFQATFTLSGGIWTITVYQNGNQVYQTTDNHSSPVGSPFYVQSGTGNDASNAQLATMNVYNSAFAPGPTTTTIPANDSHWNLSPGNWYTAGTTQQTVNSGAYAEINFTLPSYNSISSVVTLNFNVSNNTVGFKPTIAVCVDGSESETNFNIAGGAVSVSSLITDSNPTHLHSVRFRVGLLDRSVNCWNMAVANSGVTFTGVTLDIDATVSAPVQYSKKVLFFADSTMDIFQTIFDWRKIFGVEAGVVAFSGNGLTANYAADGVPFLGSSYNLILAGAARSFAGIDGAVFGYGQNDIGSETVMASNFTTLLNAILAANATIKGLIYDPFGSGSYAASVSAALSTMVTTIANTRLKFKTRAGWINTSGNQGTGVGTIDTGDTIHPTSQAMLTKVLPLMVNDVQALVAPAGSAGVPATGDTYAYLVANLGALGANATAIPTALMNTTIEGSYTFGMITRLLARLFFGKTSNGGATIRNLADTKNSITATVDSNGNRTAMTLDAT